ncbi:MAG: AraC family transcriptional regulator [Lachnospiraceae bacterium]|nr:AraC family transcriptional regulator [Lachnospiraceae bacterium]
MNSLFEYTDTLNAPYEAFLFDASKNVFPVRAHWHYFVEIMYMLEGNAIVTCDSETFNLGPDDVFIFPPSSVHSIYTSSYGPLKFYGIKFDINQLESSIHSSETGNVRFSMSFPTGMPKKEEFLQISLSEKSDTERERVKAIFEGCLKELNERNFGFYSITRSYICELLIYFLRKRRELGLSLPDTPDTRDSAGINSITEYIDEHLNEELRVEDLAKRCNMSYSYFAKCFTELYGQSCKHYISFLRLCKAENMLLFTDYDLTYISQETGFCDCSHLIHAFKEKNKITPHQFRKQHAGSNV